MGVRVLRLILAAVMIASLPAHAEPERWSRLAEKIFQHLNKEDGLPQPVVTALAEDGEGFLWVGTQGGLARWDGYRFRTYLPNRKDEKSLPDNFIQALHADLRGRLWIGTSSNGLARYERDCDCFTRFPVGEKGTIHASIQAIEDDGAGGLWAGTDGGLDHLTGGGAIRHIRRGDAEHPGLPDERILSLLRGGDGTLWVGTYTGLARLDPGKSAFTAIPLPTPEGKTPAIRSLLQDAEGRIWIGTDGQGAYFLAEGKPVQAVAETEPGPSILRDARVSGLADTGFGEVWIATKGQGLVTIDKASFRTRRIQHDPTRQTSPSGNSIWALFRDRAGLIWIGSTNGLSRHDPGQTAILTLFGESGAGGGLSAPDARAVMVDRHGLVWLGYADNGVDVIDPAGTRVASLRPNPAKPMDALPHDSVLAFAANSAGQVYIATLRGLYLADPAAHGVKRVPVTPDSPETQIGALLMQDQTLWVGTRGQGLWSLEPGARTARPWFQDRLSDKRIRAIAPAGGGKLWIGTYNGLNLVDTLSMEVRQFLADPKDAQSLSAGFVASLLTDKEGRLWIGTYGGGINILTPGSATLTRIGLADGLPDPNINAMRQDRSGAVWVSTDDGLAVVDPGSLSVRALHAAEDAVVAGYWVGSSDVTAEGELLFGGSGGLTVVRPEGFRQWNYQPPLVVTEAGIGGKPIPSLHSGQLLTLASGGSLSVEFAALDFTAPERNRYAYRLEGFDEDWIYADFRHRGIAYTNLPPGKFTLRLRGTNRDGIWAGNELAIPVTVLPNRYQSWWFKIAAGIAGLLLTILLVQLRTAYLRRRERELTEQVSQRTAQLSEANSELERRAAETEEALNQLHMAQDELVRAEKLAGLGALVAGIAHEVNTPLGNGLAVASTLKEKTAQFALQVEQGTLKRSTLASYLDDLKTASDLISRNLERAATLVRNFRTVAVDQTSEMRRVFDLAEVTEEVISTLMPTIRKSPIAVRMDVPSGVEFDSYPGSYGQVVTNLVQNALIHAFDGKENGTITLSAKALPEDKVEIAVTDDGKGMEPDIQRRVFDPFFTTKLGKGGSGLGLHLVYGMVTRVLGGQILLESTPGRGSRFTVTIPATAPVEAQAE